jgi:hypothetical protein
LVVVLLRELVLRVLAVVEVLLLRELAVEVVHLVPLYTY